MKNSTQYTNTFIMSIPFLLALYGSGGDIIPIKKINCLNNSTYIGSNYTMLPMQQFTSIDNQLYESILNFAENIITNSQDIDADLAKILNDNIMDLLA